MATPALREAIRWPLLGLSKGYGFWRKNGARLHHARSLCEYADGLRLRGSPNSGNRSDRLYRRALVELDHLSVQAGAFNESQGDVSELAVLAHRALSLARRPYRMLGWSMALCSVAISVLIFFGVLLGAAVSPSVRHRVFPRDLAEGRPWSASSSFAGMPTHGIGPASSKPAFFHTNDSEPPWLEIDLGAEHVVRSLLIVNRSDCCAERAIPLNVEALVAGEWRLIAQRRAPFSTWKYEVDPVRTSRIRLRLPGRGFLHLKRVSVYGE